MAALAVAGGGVAAGILLTQGSSGSSGGSGGGKPRYAYPESVKKQFLDACTVHTPQSVCQCVVRAYETTMPYTVYQDIARGGVRLNNQQYFRAFTQASTHCSQ